MKNKFFHAFIFLTMLFSDFRMFANPNDDSDGDPMEGEDAPPAPINGKIVFLLIAALAFAFYIYKRQRVEKA